MNKPQRMRKYSEITISPCVHTYTIDSRFKIVCIHLESFGVKKISPATHPMILNTLWEQKLLFFLGLVYNWTQNVHPFKKPFKTH